MPPKKVPDAAPRRKWSARWRRWWLFVRRRLMDMGTELARLSRDLVIGTGNLLLAALDLPLWQSLLVGLALGLVLIFVAEVIYFTLPIIYHLLKFIESAWDTLAKILSALANAIGSGINFVTSTIFHAGNVVPKVNLPRLDFGRWIPGFSRWNHLRKACAPFSNYLREASFIGRSTLNDAMCPPARYIYATWLFRVYDGLFSWTYDGAEPAPGQNCRLSGLDWLCFFLHLGKFIVFFMLPLLIAVVLFKAFRRAVVDVLWVAWDVFALTVGGLLGPMVMFAGRLLVAGPTWKTLVAKEYRQST
jgi:hypothetical protein